MTFTRINESDTVISQTEADQEYSHHQTNQKDIDYTDAKFSKILSESDKSTNSKPNNLNQKKFNEEDIESKSENNLVNNDIAEARRIRNLKKF
jgi:hypothetical protein